MNRQQRRALGLVAKYVDYVTCVRCGASIDVLWTFEDDPEDVQAVFDGLETVTCVDCESVYGFSP